MPIQQFLFFKPTSLGIHRVQARDETTEHQPEHPEIKSSGKSALDGNITSALSQWPPGWYRLQEIASLPLRRLKGLGQTRSSSARTSGGWEAIYSRVTGLSEAKPKQKPKLKRKGLGSAAGGVLAVAEPSGSCSPRRREV